MSAKLKVEVWSDVMCPFCYIGKRRFEHALDGLPFSQEVELEWKSYQLNPSLVTNTAENYYENLSKHKGVSTSEAQNMCSQVAQMAAKEGLDYHFDQAVVANSFKAHELSHFAKTYGKQDEVEELLFKLHFTEGGNIDDIEVLARIAEQVGLSGEAFKAAVRDRKYEDAVRQDIYEAQQIGVRGVPFFVFDRKYAVSGAQAVEVFRNTVEKAYDEWKRNGADALEVMEGPSCGPSGCD